MTCPSLIRGWPIPFRAIQSISTTVARRGHECEIGSRMSNRFQASWDALVSSVTGPDGTLAHETRRGLVDGQDGPANLQAFIRRLQTNSPSITDGDIQALLAEGFSEDQVLEAILCAATGAALIRLHHGLRALDEA
jgi:hypothetical protein